MLIDFWSALGGLGHQKRRFYIRGVAIFTLYTVPQKVAQTTPRNARLGAPGAPKNNNPTNNIPVEDFDVDFDIVNGPWPCGMPKGHSCLYANGGNY